MVSSSKFVISKTSVTAKTSLASQRKSVFEGNEDARSGGRIYFILAFVCCVLMSICALLLICVPPEVWAKTEHTYQVHTSLHKVHTSLRSNEFCNHSVGYFCTVKCTEIYGDNPGEVIAEYLFNISQELENECPTWTLHIQNSGFIDNTLKKGWLEYGSETLPRISSLTIQACPSLWYIEGGALSLPPLYLDILTLTDLQGLRRLTDEITQDLDQLKQFNWRENAIMEYADVDALRPFRSSLQVLELTGGFENTNIIARLIGKCALGSFKALQTLDLRYSESKGMLQLAQDHMEAAQKLQQIFMSMSGIKHLENTVFELLAATVVRIELDNNDLTTLKEQVIEPFLMYKHKTLTLKLAGNDWTCDCHLQWLQTLMLDPNSNIIVEDKPMCFRPIQNVLLIDANMTYCESPTIPNDLTISCEEETTTSTVSSTKTTPTSSTTPAGSTITIDSTTIVDSTTSVSISTPPVTMTSPTSTTPEQTTESKPTESTNCISYHESDNNSNSLSRIMDRIKRDTVIFPTKIPHFSVQEETRDDEVIVKVETGIQNDLNKRLVWSLSDGSIAGCYENLQTTILVRNLSHDKAYLFCILTNESDYTFPNHCLPIQTKPKWVNQAWLTNESQKLVLPLLVILLICTIILGSGLMLFSFWKKPTLLSSINDRVVKVNSSNHDAIVMPPKKKLKKIDENIQDDTVSIQSDPSYVSVENVSTLSLFMFRFREWIRRNSSQPECPAHPTPAPAQRYSVSISQA